MAGKSKQSAKDDIAGLAGAVQLHRRLELETRRHGSVGD